MKETVSRHPLGSPTHRTVHAKLEAAEAKVPSTPRIYHLYRPDLMPLDIAGIAHSERGQGELETPRCEREEEAGHILIVVIMIFNKRPMLSLCATPARGVTGGGGALLSQAWAWLPA